MGQTKYTSKVQEFVERHHTHTHADRQRRTGRGRQSNRHRQTANRGTHTQGISYCSGSVGFLSSVFACYHKKWLLSLWFLNASQKYINIHTRVTPVLMTVCFRDYPPKTPPKIHQYRLHSVCVGVEIRIYLPSQFGRKKKQVVFKMVEDKNVFEQSTAKLTLFVQLD